MASIGADLTLVIDNGMQTPDKITLQGAIGASPKIMVTEFQFDDETSISLAHLLMAKGVSIDSTANFDSIYRVDSAAAEHINSSGGHASIYLDSGSDVVESSGDYASIHADSGTSDIEAGGDFAHIYAGGVGQNIELSGDSGIVDAQSGDQPMAII